MGWRKEDGIHLGDEPIDLLRCCLEQVASVYEKEIGRRPTCAEVDASFALALRYSAAELISDMADREVTGVSIRSRKLGKTQPYAQGDVFAIPVSGTYYYGRVLKEKTSAGALVEIYDCESDQKPSLRQLLDNAFGILTHKHIHGIRALRSRRWPIVGHLPVPPDYAWPQFRMGSAFLGLQITCNEEKWVTDDPEEWLQAESMICFPPETVEEHLANRVKDPWPTIQMLNERDRRELIGEK